MRPSRILLGAGVVVAAVVWWLRDPGSTTDDDESVADHGSASAEGSQAGRDGTAKIRNGRTGTIQSTRGSGVTITGKVIERGDVTTNVGGVEVVFRSEAGEETVTTGGNGDYRIDLAPGTYRTFVRDENLLSVGPAGRIRLPSAPDADSIGAPDEGAMQLVVANHDLDHVDLFVTRGGTITGHVHDRSGRAIAHAVVRASGARKPVLGTDVVESDDTGAYTLHVPLGSWVISASHPRYAGALGAPEVFLSSHEEMDLTLVAGCVVSGHVLGANGQPAGDGAIERRTGQTEQEFAPNGKIAADGTFRWVTTELGDVTLRAWPWKSPPSPAQAFRCEDGGRFDNVVFQLQSRAADIAGTLADASGEPVALAFIDLQALDPGGINQQERTDIDGKWAAFQMPAGRYRVAAYSQGRGAVSTIVTSPQADVRLALGGTGRLDGATTAIADGSIELHLQSCSFDGKWMPIPDEERVVSVVGGKFTLEGVPACMLRATAGWDRRIESFEVDVKSGGNVAVNLAFPPPPEPTRDVDVPQPDYPDERGFRYDPDEDRDDPGDDYIKDDEPTVDPSAY